MEYFMICCPSGCVLGIYYCGIVCCVARQLNPLEAPIWSITSRLCEQVHCKLG